MVALLSVPAPCSNSSAPERKWCSPDAPAGGKFLGLVRLRRLWEERLDGARSLCPALLLEFIHPVRHGVDHVARRFLRRLDCRFGLFLARFLSVALLALDYFDRGFLSHNDLCFLFL